MGKLTTLKIKSLVEPGRYGDGDGLWLQVRDAKHRSWLFRYTRHGRARQMGLGELSGAPGQGVSLADARHRAQKLRAVLRDGIDLLEAKQGRIAAERAELGAMVTFKAAAQRFIAAHEASWRNAKHRAQWPATLEAHAYPIMGCRSVAKVDTAIITAVLEPIWREKPETASRLRGRIEQVLDYATARGWRTGDNPARWRGHLANLLPARSKVAAVRHQPALPWADVSSFMGALRKEAGTAARALEVLILTACRSNEVLGARWSEIDMEGRAWLIPAERMKSGKSHRVPLVTDVVKVLEGLPGPRAPDALVFEGRVVGKHLSDMALVMAVRRLNLAANGVWVDQVTKAPIVPHGFRSTFRDWAAERTAYPREMAEAALAHTLKNKTEAAYNRSDLFEKRRELMDDWSTFCRGGVS